MASLIVRDIPEKTKAAFRAAAKDAGRSMEAHLRALIEAEAARRNDRDAALERIRAWGERHKGWGEGEPMDRDSFYEGRP